MEQRRKRTIDEKSNHIKSRQKREQYMREQREIDQDLYRLDLSPSETWDYYDDLGGKQ